LVVVAHDRDARAAARRASVTTVAREQRDEQCELRLRRVLELVDETVAPAR
jgi:hypothetical protein